MNFASPLFLLAFLPLSLAGFFLLGKRLRPLWLLLASFIFVLWSGPLYFPVAVAYLLFNYAAGKRISLLGAGTPDRSRWLKLSIALNILVMLAFKALVVYGPAGMESVRALAGWSGEPIWMGYFRKVISLPTGISFYTFSMIAYLVDVAAARTRPAASLFSFSTFFFFFPKFTAGPITKYQDMAGQVDRPSVTSQDVGEGLKRFILGLAKKVLIADRLGAIVDRGLFDQAAPNLNAGAAWMVLLFYALQIYYDFSGYSDMAIGLARIMGFRIPENFNYPYLSKSISEFWRRWHITLSGWFREYVFFPLERRRAAGSGLPQAANILVVFLLTGLWHGLTLNFVIWGLIHGLAITFENTAVGKKMKNWWPPLQHVYFLAVVLTAWVFFRSNSPAFALAFLGNLFGFNAEGAPLPYSILPIINPSTWLACAAGILFSGPLFPVLWKKVIPRALANRDGERSRFPWAVDAALAGLLLVCLAVIASSTFQPYIYGNF